MFKVKEYTYSGKFGGQVLSFTIEVTDEDAKRADEDLQTQARGFMANFAANNSTITGFDKLTEYNGWIKSRVNRLMTFTVEGF